MELLVLLFVSSLLRSCGAQGPTPLFVKTGEDLPLSFTKADGLGDFISVGWMFNKKDFLVRFVPGRDPSMNPRYKGRIDVNEESYSVILKNLQDSDSGLYTARLDLGEGDQTLAEYNVTVQGSRAVTPVFVKKGDDVLLNVRTADGREGVVFVRWKFNGVGILSFLTNSRLTVSPNYTGRVEFSETNYSVKVKSLQKADSGVYSAEVVRGVKDEVVEYSVTVQDPVSPVQLSVDSVSNSSDSCNFTVSCRTQDSHINSSITCDTQSCSQDGGEQSKVTTSGALLQVHLGNGSVICNHSNQVSWTEDMEIIKHFCVHADPVTEPAYINVSLVMIAVFSVGLLFMVSAVITVNLMVKLKRIKTNN